MGKSYNDSYLLNILMDNISDTIYFKDNQHRFIKVNKAQAEALGVNSPEKAIGKTDYDFFFTEHAEAAHSDEKKLFESKKSLIGKEELIVLSDGQKRWVTATKEPFYDQEGNLIGLVGISRDISKQKLVETDLREANKEILEKNSQLEDILKQIKQLKESQDGDYFLTSLLLNPFYRNYAKSDYFKIDCFLRQKKRFSFKNYKGQRIGGDVNITDNIELHEKKYILFLNADSMGKSIQGASGSLVLGSVFASLISQNQIIRFKVLLS